MNSSLTLWKKSRPKLTDIRVNLNSVKEKYKNGHRIDWNQINDIKRKVT